MPAPRPRRPSSASAPKGRGKRSSSGKKPSSPLLPPLSLTIERLGARGDGVALWEGTPVFVPFTLPGEVVTAQPMTKRADGYSAELKSIERPSEQRQSPACPQFSRCGGCTLQHLSRQAEAEWKRSLIVDTLKQRGFEDAEALVRPTIAIPAQSRRRAVFGYRRLADRLVLGFNERASHQIIPLNDCPLLVPALSSLLPRLAGLLSPWLAKGSQGDVMAVASDCGVDLTLDLPAHPDLATREGLALVAQQLDLARLSIRVGSEIEPLAARRTPFITLGSTDIILPSGAFLQPSKEGESALQQLVLKGLEGINGAIADLFCGLGTFALPVASSGKRTVVAYDSEAIQTGPLHATGRVQAQARDLFRLPLMASEVQGFTALILDPPRAGAQQQCAELATLPHGQGPQRVVMVSCSPATFARDARILVDSGYAFLSATPVDQFVWSAHVELVAVFEKTL